MNQGRQLGFGFGKRRRVAALARSSDPYTSHLAARDVDVSAMEVTVLGTLIKNRPGLTIYEITEITRESMVSISPRIKPLVCKGLIRDSGRRRKNPSGRTAIVWVLEEEEETLQGENGNGNRGSDTQTHLHP